MSRAGPQGWRGPAVVLAAGALTLTVSLGIRHAFGLFLEPMSRDNGWTREVFAFAIALQNLVWGAAQPFAGRLADRRGAARAVLGGSVLYVAGLLLMATAHGASALALSAGVLVGLGLSGTSYPIVFGAISRCTAPERRSLATGIAMAVGSLGQFAMLPGALAAIDAIGWAGALVALAALGATMAPLSAALRERPSTAGVATGGGAREALAEALRHPGFWLLSFGFFVCGFHVVFIATHLPAFLADRGLGPRAGAAVLALVGLFNIGGSYCAGLLGGRTSKPGLLVGLYLLRAAVIAAFVLAPVTEGSAYAFGAAMGFLWLSTVPLTNGTIATLFGTRHLAMLGGVAFFFHQVGAFLGGWLGGRLYVATGSYELVWWISIALALLAALVNVPVREAPVARAAAAPEPAA
ncbi:major facilitator superfamily MFS_1 [Anaeromyxobacter sp. K]|uniref:MFS transporter n=1 Tax=Anaeromyxobacter sp. (strain K) TaxID=447217 RepID=UPI00015F8A8A|nr:MFS transporter [Anaeromyxobacter sp. K]ACG74226.1 major facilitator superfamily MFS_1 [Anaeromyxobacter sp. K]